MTVKLTRRLAFCSALFALSGLAGGMTATASHAQEASPWVASGHSSLRLLAGSRGDGVLVGGIEIQLKPGWKTYWRTPGDSGVPPRFDFSKSDNVENVTVLWPAPMKFDDGAGGASIGYANKVVLPLRIMPKDAAKPVTLRARIDYAICEKLCVPVEAAGELAFTANPSIHAPLLATALQSVPRPGKIGEGDVTIRAVRREATGRVAIDVVSQTAADLFVEGPNPNWALPIPRPAETLPGGAKRYVLKLDGIPPGETATGATLKLTLVRPIRLSNIACASTDDCRSRFCARAGAPLDPKAHRARGCQWAALVYDRPRLSGELR